MGNLGERSLLQSAARFDQLGAMFLLAPLIILHSLPHLQALYYTLAQYMQESHRSEQPSFILTPALMFLMCNLLLVGITAMGLLHQPRKRKSSVPSSLLQLPFKPVEVINLATAPITAESLLVRSATSGRKPMGRSSSSPSLYSGKPAHISLLQRSPSYNTFLPIESLSLPNPRAQEPVPPSDHPSDEEANRRFSAFTESTSSVPSSLLQLPFKPVKVINLTTDPISSESPLAGSATGGRKPMGRSSSYQSLCSVKPAQRTLLQRSPSYSTSFLPTESLSDKAANRRFNAFTESTSSVPSSLLQLSFKPKKVINLTTDPISSESPLAGSATRSRKPMGRSSSYQSLSSMKPAQRTLLRRSPSYNTFLPTESLSDEDANKRFSAFIESGFANMRRERDLD